MKFELEVAGIQETISALSEFKMLVMPEIQKEIDLAAESFRYTMQEYPPPIPTSDYVRTYEYQRSVNVIAKLEGDTVSLEASASEVNHWLRGDADGSYRGAWMHRGRWRTMLDLVQQFVPVFISHVEQRLERLIGRLFK